MALNEKDDNDVQALFGPLLATQRELMRIIDITGQVEEVMDFAIDVGMDGAAMHLQTIRWDLHCVAGLLRQQLITQMIQLAPYFRRR